MSLLPDQDKAFSFNINHAPPVRKLFSDTTEDSGQEYLSNKTFRVYLRIKPTSDLNECISIVDSKNLVCRPPSNSKYRKPGKVEYEFSYIFGPKTTQHEVFSNCVLDCVEDLLGGQNSLIFAYGTTNAGKTFTVQGSEEFPGIIPRALYTLFSNIHIDSTSRYKPYMAIDILKLSPESFQNEIQLKNEMIRSHRKLSKNATTEASRIMKMLEKHYIELKGNGMNSSVWISFIEVYNDMIFDLLDSSPSRRHLEVKGVQDNFYVKGLKKICVNSAEEAYAIYQFGRENLNVASTKLNDRSSRSHCIFTIDVINLQNYREPYVSKLCICDLAGIERQTKAQNTGQRLTESSNINGSLFQLNRCLRTIRENQAKNINQIIPYRHSKLTKLFHSALDNRTSDKIVMIVNINPAPVLYDETQQVLKVCSTAKEIKDKPMICNKIVIPNSRFSNFIYGQDSRSIEEESEDEFSNCDDDSVGDMKEREVQKLRENVSYLESEIEKYKMKIDIYVKDAEDTKEIRDRMDKRYKKIIADLNQQREELRSELREARRNTIFEHSAGDVIKQELMKKDTIIEELEKKLQEYEMKQSRKSSIVEITSKELLEKDIKLNELESLLEEVRKEYIDLNGKWETACSEITDLEMEINEKNELNDYLGDSNDKKDKLIEELEQKIEGLEEKLSEDTREHEKILNDLETDRDKFKDELLKSENLISSLKSENDELKEKLSQFEYTVAEESTAIEQLRNEKTELKNECLQSENIIAHQKELIIKLQNEMEVLREVEAAKKLLEEKQKSMEKETDSLKSQLNKLQEAYFRLDGSRLDFQKKFECFSIKDDTDDKVKNSEANSRRYNTRKQNLKTPGKENKFALKTSPVALFKKSRGKEKVVPLGNHVLNDTNASLEADIFRNIPEKDETFKDVTVSGKKKLFPCSPLFVDLSNESSDKDYSICLDLTNMASQTRATPAQTVKSLRKRRVN